MRRPLLITLAAAVVLVAGCAGAPEPSTIAATAVAPPLPPGRGGAPPPAPAGVLGGPPTAARIRYRCLE
ncbi:hypothetical protein ACFV24_18270, partial [Nocardia fluminea]